MTKLLWIFYFRIAIEIKTVFLDIKELTLFLNIKIHTKYIVQQTAYLQKYIFECNEDF